MRFVERMLVEVFLALFGSWNTVSVIGIENIPKEGKFIAASNHISYLDPVIILSFLHKRRPMAPVATKGLFRFPLKTALRSASAVPVERGSLKQRRFLRDALESLEKRPLLIFPEGGVKRYAKGKKVPGGAGYIAVKAQSPVIPIRIEGTDKALPAGSFWLRRYPIRIKVGNPIVLKHGKRSYSEAAGEIMSTIYSL